MRFCLFGIIGGWRPGIGARFFQPTGMGGNLTGSPGFHPAGMGGNLIGSPGFHPAGMGGKLGSNLSGGGGGFGCAVGAGLGRFAGGPSSTIVSRRVFEGPLAIGCGFGAASSDGIWLTSCRMCAPRARLLATIVICMCMRHGSVHASVRVCTWVLAWVHVCVRACALLVARWHTRIEGHAMRAHTTGSGRGTG